MNIIKKISILPLLCMAVAVLSTACSDWTENESLNIHYPSLEEQNPELYKQYLEALRAYKASDHKVMFVTFRNSATTPTHRNQHLTVLPDSIDFVCLANPDNLFPALAEQMREVREKKATRFVYQIDYNAIETLWKKVLEEEEAAKPEEPVDPDQPEQTAVAQEDGDSEPEDPAAALEKRFLAFCSEQVGQQLAYCDKYGYDGIEVNYTGRSPIAMQHEEKAQYAARQEAFFAGVKSWLDTHADKLLFFRGKPQNLVDKGVLQLCDYIIIPTLEAISGDQMSYAVLMACVADVPADRFIIGVKTPSLTDPTDNSGYFSGVEADGKTKIRASRGAAEWVVAPAASYTKAGVAIADVENDYFFRYSVYKNVREAIDIMNPAPKN